MVKKKINGQWVDDYSLERAIREKNKKMVDKIEKKMKEGKIVRIM